jgi:hypothetical protein
MARPEKILSETQRAEVETLAALLTAEQVADYFGIGRTTFFSMMNRDPDIAERYKRGKARVIGVIAQGLINKARAGDTASMIFFLKTQAGWRETTRIEHGLPEPDKIAPDGGSAADRLRDYLDVIAERKNAAEAYALTLEPTADGGVRITSPYDPPEYEVEDALREDRG